MDALPTSLTPLEGGYSGETFLATVAGEPVVARVYAGRSASRGPLAPEIDAAVLELVRGLLPVPEVLEVRRGSPDGDLPGLLLTSRLPGERLDLVLPDLDRERRERVGHRLGTLLGRLGHMVQPRAGVFVDRTLVAADLPPGGDDLATWVADRSGSLLAAGLGAAAVDGLTVLADEAQDLLDLDPRACLVHADLNPKNLLVDPDTLEVTAVLDWEFAHAGSPYADLGNLLRLDRDPAYVGAVLAGYRDLMPAVPPDVLDRARAADLFALVDLAVRDQPNPVVTAARDLLRAVGQSGDLHAVG